MVLDSIGKSQESAVELVREYLQAELNVKMVGIKLVNGANSLRSKLSSWFDIDNIATKRYEIGKIIMRNAKDLG